MAHSPTRRAVLATGASLVAASVLTPKAEASDSKPAPGPGLPSPAPAVAPPPTSVTPPAAGPFQLMKLPYAEDALAPAISAQTVGLHWGKHHRGYVEKLNGFVGNRTDSPTLEKLIKESAGKPDQAPIFNAAGQVWNHDFYWKSLSPKGGGKPGPKLSKLMEAAGGFDAVKKEFASAAAGHFGSGWAWLVLDEKGKLAVTHTANADSPLTANQRPLLTLDVWEHAYYLDFQNRRNEYIGAVLDKLINWEFAEANLA